MLIEGSQMRLESLESVTPVPRYSNLLDLGLNTNHELETRD